MVAATPAALASSIARKAVEVQTAAATLTRLSARLTSPTEVESMTSAYAYDHAEEELIWAAEALEEAASALRSLTAYTVTGAPREQVLNELIAEVRGKLVDAQR